MNWPRAACSLAWLTVFSVLAGENAGSGYRSKATSPPPELVSQASKELSLKPSRPATGVDTQFNLDESCLNHVDLVNVTAVAPSGSFLKAELTNDNKKGSSRLNSSIPPAYHEKWPTSLCQYSLSRSGP